MVICNFYPRQTFLPLLLGSITEATGISVLTWALHKGHHVTIAFMMGLTGAGTGLRFMPGTLHGIGFFPNNISSVIAMNAFAIPFGGTLAMTIMTSVFFNKAGFSINATGGSSPIGQGISSLPPAIRGPIREKARQGIVWAFISILPFMWLCVLAATGLGNVRITRKRKIDVQGKMDFSENTTEEAYLAGYVRRRFMGGRKEKEKGVITEENKGKAPERILVTEANAV
jgi:hypothetical protein